MSSASQASPGAGSAGDGAVVSQTAFLTGFRVADTFLHLAMAVSVICLTTDEPLLALLLMLCRETRSMRPAVIEAMAVTIQSLLLSNHQGPGDQAVAIRQHFWRTDWTRLHEKFRGVHH